MTKKLPEKRYEVAKKAILDYVKKERLKDGDRLPPERRMCERFGVSMITIRRALDMLATDGMIVKRQGSGNYLKIETKKRIALLTESRYLHPVFAEKMIGDINRGNSTFEIKHVSLTDTSRGTINRYAMESSTPCILLGRGYFSDCSTVNDVIALEGLRGLEDVLSELPENMDFRMPDANGVKKHFFLPLFLTPTVFAINGDLARASGLPDDRPPSDWKEILDWCARFQRWSAGRGNAFSPTYGMGERLFGAHYGYACMALERRVLSDDLLDLDRPEFHDFVEFIGNLIASGSMDIVDSSMQSNHEPFVDGKYLCHLSARTWMAYEMEEFGSDFECRFFPVPPKRKNGLRVSRSGSVMLGIVNSGLKTADVRVCWNAMKALFDYPELHEVAYNLKIMPASLSAVRKLSKTHPLFKTFEESLRFCELEPGSEIGHKKRMAIDAVLSGVLRQARKTSGLNLNVADSVRSIVANPVGDYEDHFLGPVTGVHAK